MIMIFPMDNTNNFNSLGGSTGSPLEHCVDNVKEKQDVPFAKHYPNEPGYVDHKSLKLQVLVLVITNNFAIVFIRLL